MATVALVKEAHAQPRPSGIGSSYLEDQFTAGADEQQQLWSAEGVRQARPHQARAKGLDLATTAVVSVLAEQEKEVEQAHADHQHAARVLGPLVRREPFAKLRYKLCWPLLILGDTAGVWASAVTNGEVIYIAFGQALSSGVAAACAGLVGAELKDIRMARERKRDPGSLSEDEQRYAHLFLGNEGGMGIVKLIGLLSLLVVALIAVGIFALRRGVEGSDAGLTFGLLAAATAIGSGLLSYATRDVVADSLATMEKRVRLAERRYLRLAASSAPRQHAEAQELARSQEIEHELRGQAASKRVESLSARTMSRNPHVFGHGYSAETQCGGIGWRCRRGEDT
jgi:hypothetical protein